MHTKEEILRGEYTINTNIILAIFCIVFFSSGSYSQTTYPENEDGQFEDMLTPEYYLSETASPFRTEVNKFVYFTRVVDFQHPLENTNGDIPTHEITRNFGDGIGGPAGTSQHHPAIDFHVGENETSVSMFAVYSGYVTTYTDAPKYRHYLAISKEIFDSTSTSIGILVTLYAHIDLNLDVTDGINLNGQYVEQGDLVSRNLYSGTVGGPHLHFETRFYRPNDSGDEEFYSFVGPEGSEIFTEPSAGSWSYGYWDPHVGYGFSNPDNHFLDPLTLISNNTRKLPDSITLSQNYPNPFNPTTSIDYTLLADQNISLEVFDIKGTKVQTLKKGFHNKGMYNAYFSGQELSSGVYLYCLKANNQSETRKMLLVR